MTEEEINSFSMELEKRIKDISIEEVYEDNIDFNMFPNVKINESLLEKEYTANKKKNLTPLEVLIADYQYLFLIGDAGSGKTTAVDYLEAKWIFQKRPVYKIKLKASLKGNKVSDLLEEIKNFPNETVIIIDGIDETYQSCDENIIGDVAKKIEEIRKMGKFKVIITSRFDVNENNNFKCFQRVYMQALNKTQIKNVLNEEFIDIDENLLDLNLYGTPLFLSIIKKMAKRTTLEKETFNNETDLLMTYFKLIYEEKGGDNLKDTLKGIGDCLFQYRKDGKVEKNIFENHEKVVKKYLTSIFSVEEGRLIPSHETFADFVVGYYLANQIKEKNINIKGLFSPENKKMNKLSSLTELGFLSRKSLWFTGKLLQKEPREVIEERFKVFNKEIKKSPSLLYSYIVNVYISYNNDTIEKNKIFRIGKPYYKLLRDYGFYGKILLKIKTKQNHIFRYNIVIKVNEKKYWLINTKGTCFYTYKEVLNNLLNVDNRCVDDEELEEIIDKQKEIVNYNKCIKRITKLSDFNEVFVPMLSWGLIIPLLIFVFVKWGLITPLPIIANLYSKIANIDSIVLNMLAGTGIWILLIILSFIISTISVFVVYTFLFLLCSLILKFKIKKVAINFASRFGFKAYYNKFDILWIGDNIRFIFKNNNYEDWCMSVIENIAKESSNKEIAYKTSMELSRAYVEKDDLFNAFLFARAMKEFSIANEEDWLNLKKIL